MLDKKRLNILIRENNPGKTAIIYALRIFLVMGIDKEMMIQNLFLQQLTKQEQHAEHYAK